ncbi:MAG: DNA primase [Solirubrobacteraceae bacterium]|nr:DNA primase [Solirubrobacteraceae bacterium]
MARYLREDIDRVRDATDFIAVVERHTELRRVGSGRMEGICPFHDDRSPSLSVKPDDKLFHCFGCGEGGDLFAFVEKTEGVDFVGALELLADRAGIELRTEDEDPKAAARRARERKLMELLDRTSRYYERQLWDTAQGAAARDELLRRGLDPAMLREFRVGYAPDAWERVTEGSRRAGYGVQDLLDAGLAQRSLRDRSRVYDRFRHRITFPLADRRGRINGFGARRMDPEEKAKYVNSAEGVVFHKGRNVYAAHLARPAAAKRDEVILCEGYTDVIALHQAGLRHAVGLMGTALTPDQVTELRRLAPTVVLALDADEAGRKAMLRADELTRGADIELQVVTLPDGMDPADLLLQRGADAVAAAFARPVPVARFRVESLLAAADLSDDRGKDRLLAELRPVFAGIPAGFQRIGLLGEVAGRLGIDAEALDGLLGAPTARVTTRPGPGGGRAVRAVGGGGGGGVADRSGGRGPGGAADAGRGAPSPTVPEAEIEFLAVCHAVGAPALPLLAPDAVARYLSAPVARAAAAAMAVATTPTGEDAGRPDAAPRPPVDGGSAPARAPATVDGAGPGHDPGVVAVLDTVARRAVTLRSPSPAEARLLAVRLERDAVQRRLRHAGPDVDDEQRMALTRRLADLQALFRRAYDDALRGA